MHTIITNQFQIIQVLFVGVIYYLFGSFILLAFLFNAAIAYVSFETVQYLEHYGLQRKKNEKGRHERVKAHHSWNSNHIFGRLMMFNLSRHSDHHFKAHKKYQVLKIKTKLIFIRILNIIIILQDQLFIAHIKYKTFHSRVTHTPTS